jgi:hypothetical protein
LLVGANLRRRVLNLTDDNQGGTAPFSEEPNASESPATEKTATTVAVADEPADTTSTAVDASEENPAATPFEGPRPSPVVPHAIKAPGCPR